MTNDSLSQIALEFCRECLGWEEASAGFSLDGVIWNGMRREDMKGFRFTDLNAVMEAARGWCRSAGLRFSLHYKTYLHGEDWHYADIWWPVDQVHGSACAENPCHALLAACVEASRKQKKGVA